MKKIQNFVKLFTFKTNRDNYNSLHIRIQSKMEISQFSNKLRQIIEQENKNTTKSLWLYLNKDNSKFLQTAFNKGFKIHHGKETDIVLNQWLLQERENKIPLFSRFYIATGGIIINDGKLLMIQQANGNRKNDWGIPGGLVDMNQPLSLATERQVRQQTNLKVKFKYMVYMRQLDHTLFDGTDLYYANYVQLDKSSLSDLKLCQNQLKAFKWVDLFKTQQFINTHQIRNTQKHLLTYLGQLFKSGFNFQNAIPNTHQQFGILIAGRTKQFQEHRLIQFP